MLSVACSQAVLTSSLIACSMQIRRGKQGQRETWSRVGMSGGQRMDTLGVVPDGESQSHFWSCLFKGLRPEHICKGAPIPFIIHSILCLPDAITRDQISHFCIRILQNPCKQQKKEVRLHNCSAAKQKQSNGWSKRQKNGKLHSGSASGSDWKSRAKEIHLHNCSAAKHKQSNGWSEKAKEWQATLW